MGKVCSNLSTPEIDTGKQELPLEELERVEGGLFSALAGKRGG